jgi:hypothetical protein
MSPFLAPPLALAAVERADAGLPQPVAGPAAVGHLTVPVHSQYKNW